MFSAQLLKYWLENECWVVAMSENSTDMLYSEDICCLPASGYDFCESGWTGVSGVSGHWGFRLPERKPKWVFEEAELGHGEAVVISA